MQPPQKLIESFEMLSPPISATAADTLLQSNQIRYSICSLVNDRTQYETMLHSFSESGFTAPSCEFLYLDNSLANSFDAYTGLNIFLRVARGAYVILCHQDIKLLEDGIVQLDAIIQDLDIRDPAWGLFGNAGGLERGGLAVHIFDPVGEDRRVGGPFPVRAACLDENFIVMRRSANLTVSRDLKGFHLYGTDLVLIAERLGYSAYVVDFYLRHYGHGRMDESFRDAQRALIEKHKVACRWRWMTTTCVEFPLTGSAVVQRVATSNFGMWLVKLLMKLRRWIAVLLFIEARTTNIPATSNSNSSTVAPKGSCNPRATL